MDTAEQEVSSTTILVIDDDPVAQTSLGALLSKEPYTLVYAEGGEDGIKKARQIKPDVILLDMMMPDIDGFEVCRKIRECASIAEIPIVMITTLDDRASQLEGIEAGADGFMSKPYDRLELVIRLKSITRLNRYRKLAEQRNKIEEMHKELLLSYDKTIEGWSQALDLRDEETEGHTLRVAEKTLMLANMMGIADDEQMQDIWRGAMLHDVGKLGVPDEILLKPGKLTDAEWSIMRQHPQHAYRWMKDIPFLKEAVVVPYSHHERWDGSGYPQGLKGEEIPLAARMFAVIDVWDAITSDRPYRKAFTREEAADHIKAGSGTHFDPNVVDVFLRHLHQF